MHYFLLILLFISNNVIFANIEISLPKGHLINKVESEEPYYLHKLSLISDNGYDKIEFSKNYYKNKKNNYFIRVVGLKNIENSELSRLDLRFDKEIVRLDLQDVLTFREIKYKDGSSGYIRYAAVGFGEDKSMFDKILNTRTDFAFQIAYKDNQPSNVYIVKDDKLLSLQKQLKKFFKKGYKK